MKKLFTLLTLVLVAVSCFATDYNGDLAVTVQPLLGKSSTQTTKGAVVSVNKQEDGKYTIILKDFKYGVLNLGDIELNNVDATTSNDVTTLTTKQSGKKILVYTVGIELKGEINKDKFQADIDISGVTGFKKISATFNGTDPTYKPTTSISNLPVDNDSEKVELYNLSGQRISEAKPGQVVIEKRGNKVVKKVVK